MAKSIAIKWRGGTDELFFILNENGFQNGFSLGVPVRAGGINAQFGWTYSNNEIFTETKGETTNNSITLNGTIANNNYKCFFYRFFVYCWKIYWVFEV